MKSRLDLKSIVVATMLCVLFFCGSSLATTEQVDEKNNYSLIRVACVGDSITYGSGIEDRENDSYPAKLQKLLGNKYLVRNFGVPGARVSHLSRKPYSNRKEFVAAQAFNPDVVVIALGINDTSVNEWQSNKEVFIKDYCSLISSFKELATKPRILLSNLMPVFQPYEPYLEIQENIDQADALISQVAKEKSLSVIDLFGRLDCEPQYYASDGLHPSKDGALIIAEMVSKAITGDHSGLSMPPVFGNHMVLQRQKNIKVWGKADSNSTIEVVLNSVVRKTVVDCNGNWSVEFQPMEAGGPYALEISDGKTNITYRDVLIGEVWYCAGQSNMEWMFRQDRDYDVEKFKTDYPGLRVLNRDPIAKTSKRAFTQNELDKLNIDEYYSGSWAVSKNGSVSDISAIAYYFGREIHRATGVPVGIIESAVGGSTTEAWMPREALNEDGLYVLTNDWLNNPYYSEWPKQRASRNISLWLKGSRETPRPHHPYEPCFLFNADVAQMSNFAIRGVLWYQGESNATQNDSSVARDKKQNKRLFENLIKSWREVFGDANLPFYYVQLPNLNRNWMDYRQMQLDVLNSIPNTGMAVTIDLGNPTNVHPANKIEVAHRLALWALAKQYGKDVEYSGPLCKSAEFIGDEVAIVFDHVGQGLRTNDAKDVAGFEVAGEDGTWHNAEARIQGDRVIVISDQVERPLKVRYAWAPNPVANLVNSEKLPASPFEHYVLTK